MSNRTSKKITRNSTATIHFGDARTNTRHPTKNRAADAKRSMKKLRELLCRNGERTNGGACAGCASPCRFGEKYLKRQKEGETT